MIDRAELASRIAAAVASWAAMTQAERDEMIRQQRESWVRAEVNWPKPRFHYVDGVKVYDSYEDYCND